MLNLDAIAEVLIEVSRTAPVNGRLVRVGKVVGVVVYHGRDRYSHAHRYGDEASQHLRQCGGRCGYRVGIKTPDGTKFFDARNVIVCVES